MSHKNATKIVWHILDQLGSLQASGHNRLVSCHRFIHLAYPHSPSFLPRGGLKDNDKIEIGISIL